MKFAILKNLFATLILFLMSNFSLQAKYYYFSGTNGNDSYSVTQAQNEATPWRSIQQLNSFMSQLLPGDFVLFKRGETFNGNILITKSGTISSPIVFGAYGTGAKPIISGFATPTSFTSIGGGIFESNVLTTGAVVNQVLINGVEYAMGRFPNANAINGGYLNFESFGTNLIIDNELTSTLNWTGAEVVIRSSRWTIDELKITNHTGTTIQYATPTTYTLINKYGYFIQNSDKALDQFGEWFYDPATRKIKIFFGSIIPTGTQVQVSSVDNLLNIGGNNVIVENLNFWGSNLDAVRNTGNLQNIIVRNCYILNSGVNAISFTGETPNLVIDSCTITNTNNNGITLTAGCINASITKNVITNTGLFAGMGKNGDGNYIALRCDAPGLLAEYNRILKCGYNGISFSKDNITIKNNLIDSFCMVKDDGAGIYTSTGSSNTVYYNRKIIGNIILNGVAAKFGVDVINSYLPAVGIYLDENATYVDVLNNTVANCAKTGMNVHNSRLFNVLNNTFYNNFTQFATSRGASPITGAVIKNNLFISKAAFQNVASYYSVLNDVSTIGIIDSNIYARPILDSATVKMEFPNMGWGYRTLQFWQTYSGKDLNSKKTIRTIKNVNEFDFKYNATDRPIVYYFLGLSKIDVAGNVFNNSIIIPAWGSRVLIANGTTPIVNQAPLANSGNDTVITLPANTVILRGTASDIDGTVNSYSWVKVSGPSAGTITKPDTAVTTLNGLVSGVYQYELTVTDNNVAIGKDTLKITVNTALNVAPVSRAGVDVVMTLPVNSTTLGGTGTDADGTVSSFAWTKIAGPAGGLIVSPNVASTSINSLVQGIYQFELTVIDNNGARGKDTLQITVNAAINIRPVANAGVDIFITLPINTATLNGSGTDADGTISSFLWIKLSGPATGNLVAATSAIATLNSLVQGVYQYQLTLTDNRGAIGRDTIIITVNGLQLLNISPLANAGPNFTVTLPTTTTTISGTGTDADGTISNYAWAKIGSPIAGGNIVSPNAANTSINGLVQGVYQFELTVTDNMTKTAKDTIQITVFPEINITPIANAGADMTITLPISTTTLSGVGTDADGTVNSYAWAKITGPVTGGNLVSSNLATTSVNGFIQGIYQFELTIIDNRGAVAKDTVRITVNLAPNVAPVANAGTDMSITLPISTTTISGTGTDADGTVNSYAWAKITGPVTGGNLVSPNLATTSTNGFIQGIYQFELTITDNRGAVAKDTVRITVNPAPNVAPVANAGVDMSITLPLITTILSGTGTDANGTISSFAWSKIAGPAAGIIVSPNMAVTSINSLVQGVYQFELTVSDNNGATAKDTVQITVNPVSAFTLLPAVNPLFAVNGIDYKYYEGVWMVLPAFDLLNPIKTGTTPNFDITLANRSRDMGFSFTGYVEVPTDGLYTFFTTSDDGSSLYIDNILTVDNDGQHGVQERSGTIGLKAGKHFIKGLYFQGPAGLTFSVSYQSSGITKQTIPLSALFRDELLPSVNPLNTVNGLDYKYYEGVWSVLPAFDLLTPVKSGTTTNFDITLANRTRDMGFSFTGYIDVPVDGLYTFFTTSDDGSILYIDDVLTVNNDGQHGALEKSGIIGLKAGKHFIKGLYFQGPAGFTFIVSYRSNGIAKQTIPLSALYRINNSVAARSFTSVSTISTTTPLNITRELSVSSFPNPFVTDFSLKIDGNSSDKVEIIVVNADGNIVYKTSGNANTIYRFGNILKKGVYLIKVFQNKKTQNLKVIKM